MGSQRVRHKWSNLAFTQWTKKILTYGGKIKEGKGKEDNEKVSLKEEDRENAIWSLAKFTLTQIMICLTCNILH